MRSQLSEARPGVRCFSGDHPWIENGNAGVASEILDVEGQDAPDSMDHHRGHQAGIVAVPSGYAIGGDEPLEVTHLPHRLLNRKAKTVLHRWTRRDGPEFEQMLRSYVRRFISEAKHIKRPLGYRSMSRMRLRYPREKL